MTVATMRRLSGVLSLCALMTACGGGGSDVPAPSAAPAPADTAISAQPQSASVLTGDTATFAVSATGTGLTYQWQRNGAPIAGATSSSYTTPPAAYTDHGAQYSVTVGGAGGSATSTVATLTLKLSANQEIRERLALDPGASSTLAWNLNLSGPQTTGINSLASIGSEPQTVSPLTAGPQISVDAVPVNMTSTLAMPTFAPTRYLKNGAIVVAPATQGSYRVSYVGSDIRMDTLASDNTTVVTSHIRSDYSWGALTGLLSASPAEFAHSYNSLFANPAILSPTAAYAAGAGYSRYTAKQLGDRYTAFDCTTATTGANITPCQTGTTLNAALTAGITSASDGVTYHVADGTVTSVDGVSVWVAAAERPKSATMSFTIQYRVYFEMSGNVYTGTLVKDGTVLGGGYYVSNLSGLTVTDRLTFLPYVVRMNKAARDSIAAGVTL